jgi:hypothetical protein
MSFDAEQLRCGSVLHGLYAHALIHPALSASRSKARPRTISVSALEKIFALLRFRSIVGDEVWLKSFTERNRSGMHLVSSDTPERQFIDFCALRALFDLCWDCTLWVALTADRERRASSG